MTLVLAALAACRKDTGAVLPPPPPTALPEPAPAAPEDPEAALLRTLSERDDPGCARIEAGLPDPVASLRRVVAEVRMPPAAPLRAAECLLVGHAEAVGADVDAWLADPEAGGLARLLAGHREALTPAQLAAAAAGPHAALFAQP